ncbi:hypothetical protein [Kitasatospora sp. NPDC088548]|uniref:hypothetical protein n=1 Tax=Kitasatospora sp. NPDC088548 TaxID=3364075 RepID=UPI0037F8FA9C
MGVRRRLHGVVAATVLAALAVGCGGAEKPGGADREAVAEPPIARTAAAPADGAPVALPLDGYSVGADESALIFRAMGQATRSCMAAKGFDYDPGEVPAAPPATPVDPGTLGLLSATAARQTGYHRPPRPAGGVSGTSGNGPARSAEFQRALQGEAGRKAGLADSGADRGCMGEFERQLQAAGVKSTASDLVGTLRTKAYDRTSSDSRVTAALSAWHSCMAALGYGYANPVQASSAAWPDPVSQQEKDTATADMDCKARTGLLETWYAVQTAYQQQYIAGNEAALEAVRETSGRRVAAAKKALGRL